MIVYVISLQYNNRSSADRQTKEYGTKIERPEFLYAVMHEMCPWFEHECDNELEGYRE